MGKKRVSIYIDEDNWEHIKNEAWRLRTSASALIGKLVTAEIKIRYDDHITIAESEKKVEEVKERVADVIGYSKDRQLGKKGKKK